MGAPKSRLSPVTARLYAAAQEAFEQYRLDRGLRFPLHVEQIEGYLDHVMRRRGRSSVPVHLSAIARMYRDRGLSLDTKREAIQRIVMRARRNA
jgi:hypothetical protein